jgi:para-aminobenzoate synthetase component I
LLPAGALDRGGISIRPMRSSEIPFINPIAAFAPYADEPWAVLLDSGGGDVQRGRYAFIAIRPYRTIMATDARVLVDGQVVAGDPFTVLQAELGPFAPPTSSAPLPFMGGAVGLFGYELGGHLERAPERHRSGQTEMAVGLYDVIAGFDLLERRAWVVAARPDAQARADELARQLAMVGELAPAAPLPALQCRPEFSRDEYIRRVRRIIDYIHAGDVFQVNFSQRFLAHRPAGLRGFDLYRRLRAINPAPFGAFLQFGAPLTVASASPERFLSIDRQGRVEARPIKGTRRRSPIPGDDLAIAAELAVCTKDRAENLMITDLLRNDIGRVARVGSVRVPSLLAVESYPTVHHLVSVIEGRLRPGLGPIDLLRATFPGGSITGAPKVRAMEIIDELEPAARGPYCGAIGWIGFDGAMDTSIVIRALTLTLDCVIAQAGGGIVADSDPTAEYAEMMTKVAPALAALGINEEDAWSYG